MRNPLADKVTGIKPSGIRKFFDIVSERKDAISLGVGEPDFDTPWHIRDEGIYSLEKGKTFYTSNAGLKELREEICRYLQRKQGLVYDPLKEVVVTVGGSEAIDIGLRAMVNPGDEVLIPQPSYVSYEPCAVLAGAVPVIINLKAENEFRLTARELEEAVTDRTKILILPFPNNPTGAVYSAEQLKSVPPQWKKRFFKSMSGGSQYQVLPELKEEVIFRQFNLMDPFPFRKKMHTIFLRNVMIYFDNKTKQELVRKVYDALEPGGYLFIGTTETIDRNSTPFQIIQPSIFRK